MLMKNNKTQPKKKREDAPARHPIQRPSFVSWALMTPAERGNFALQWVMRDLRLFEKYGITDLRGLDCDVDNPWRKLALALAERYEDGFKLRGRGRPKEHDDDSELILMVELLRHRDGLSVRRACKTIAEKGALSGNPDSLYERHKSLMKVRRGWPVLLEVLEKIGGNRYVETLEETFGAKLN
jgi:hypothetical protein